MSVEEKVACSVVARMMDTTKALCEACIILEKSVGCPKDVAGEQFPMSTVTSVCGCNEHCCPAPRDCWYQLLTRKVVE